MCFSLVVLVHDAFGLKQEVWPEKQLATVSTNSRSTADQRRRGNQLDMLSRYLRACLRVCVCACACVRVCACARVRVRACAAPPNQLFRADVGTTETVFGEITRCSQPQLVVVTSAATIILLAAKACCPTVHWARSSTCWSTLTKGARARTSACCLPPSAHPRTPAHFRTRNLKWTWRSTTETRNGKPHSAPSLRGWCTSIES